MLEETVLRDGVKVIVADKECGITYHRRETREERRAIKEDGFLAEKRFVNVNPDVCENCLECTLATGCPGLTFVETPFGAKIQTDLSWCVADTACTKIYACPSFEEITVVRTQKPPAPIDQLDLANIPLPKLREFEHVWHCHLAGVGGQGIGVCTATIVRAGFKQGYHVVFCDKKGLAIRNGGVFSQITFTKHGDHTSVHHSLRPGRPVARRRSRWRPCAVSTRKATCASAAPSAPPRWSICSRRRRS